MQENVEQSTRAERDANGRWLVAPKGARPWRKGESGNPQGAGDAYHAALKRVRARSSDIVERMVRDFIRLGISEAAARAQVTTMLANAATTQEPSTEVAEGAEVVEVVEEVQG